MDDAVARELDKLRADSAARQSQIQDELAQRKQLALTFSTTLQDNGIAPFPIYTSNIHSMEKQNFTAHVYEWTHVGEGWPTAPEFPSTLWVDETPNGCAMGDVITTQGVVCDAHWERTPSQDHSDRFSSTIRRFNSRTIEQAHYKHFMSITKPPTEANYPHFLGVTPEVIARSIYFYLG